MHRTPSFSKLHILLQQRPSVVLYRLTILQPSGGAWHTATGHPFDLGPVDASQVTAPASAHNGREGVNMVSCRMRVCLYDSACVVWCGVVWCGVVWCGVVWCVVVVGVCLLSLLRVCAAWRVYECACGCACVCVCVSGRICVLVRAVACVVA